jgi:hypothetical protein
MIVPDKAYPVIGVFPSNPCKQLRQIFRKWLVHDPNSKFKGQNVKESSVGSPHLEVHSRQSTVGS